MSDLQNLENEISNEALIENVKMGFSEFITNANDYILNMENAQTGPEAYNEMAKSADALKLAMGDNNFLLHNKITNEYETLSAERIDRIMDETRTGNLGYYVEEEIITSDAIFLVRTFIYDDEIDDMYDITLVTPKTRSGAYFKYRHTSTLDLTQLQILQEKDSDEKYEQVTEDHCIINAIKLSLPESLELTKFLESLKLKIGYKQFKAMELTKLLPDWLKITMTKYNENMERITECNYMSPNAKKDKKLITHTSRIFLYREHYMPNIKINNKLATTLVRNLHKKNQFIPCVKSYRKEIDSSEQTIKMCNILEEQKPFKIKKVNNRIKYINYFADFESIVHGTDCHLPFLIGYIDSDNNYYAHKARSFEELQEAKIFSKMLDNMISKNPGEKYFKIYFHNLKYDFTFVKVNKYITIQSESERNGVLYSATLLYKNITFRLVDSYKMIPVKLGSFASMFQLESAKMNFELYNIIDIENFCKTSIPLEDFKVLLREREGREYDEKDFKDYIVDNEYRHIKHYADYLKLDCLTLKQGISKFDEVIREVCGLSVYDFLTISSLGFYYLQKEGGLDGLYSVSGNLLNYIMGAVVGGRVSLRNNEKIDITKRIQDFDGVSLYPSAMVRPDLILPKGRAEYFTGKTLEEINEHYSQYIITCTLCIKKTQQIPMLSKKIKGVRQWTNDITIIDPVRIDKTTLEDMINFCDAEVVDILHGVGWWKINGVNTKICEIIKPLFERRLKAKAEGNNALQNTLKLILNSIYGKSLLKGQHTEIKYIRGKPKFESYLLNNYHKVKQIKQLDIPNDEYTRYRIKAYKPTEDNFNYAHVGCFILSISKRIMNEIFNIANDNNINIYYNDTDSMFTDEDTLQELADKFKERYGRQLIGKQLGQFHSDLASDIIKGDLHATRFIGLGKKCYIAQIENAKGEIDYHVRFKGASRENIDEYCKENNINIINFYEKLYNGEKLSLDICKGKARFEFGTHSVKTRGKLIKRYQF